MSFKLSEQLDADADAAFALYQKYIESNRWRFPESVLSVIENPDWDGGSFSRAPYYSELKNVQISGFGSKENKLEILLSKPAVNLEIQINYFGVFNFSFPRSELLEYFGCWRYNQFKFYDPYQTHGVKDKKMFTHEIEWVGGVIWSITASEIEVIWREVESK